MPSNTNKHIAVLSFPFASHPKNLLHLMLKMSNASPHILFSFFNTKHCNDSLLSGLQLPSNIKVYNVEDDRFTGNSIKQIDLFLDAAPEILTRMIKTVVEETGMKISCIISAAFTTFAGDIAEKFNASWIALMTSSPMSLSAHLYTPIIREKYFAETMEKDQELNFVPGLSMLRVRDLPGEVLRMVGPGESTFSKQLSKIGEALPKATAVAVICYEDMIPETLNNDLKSKFKNYLNLGFLSMSLPPEPQNSDSDATGCLSWLDKQPSKSVAYIGFGTVAALPEQEMKDLAEALESSKIPFLWALNDNLKEKLPNGFVERTSKQGKIVPWTPQTLVLAHDSVAVHISHGGYNSVCESIVYGVPMICRPIFADQMTIARMAEVGWGISVNVEDGIITKNGLLKDLEMFYPVANEKGKKMRENVEKLKDVVLKAALPGGSAARDFTKLMGLISMV
ncbi:UDP-Glycosyltransferase superfamily protein [Euphorbia peplus]|nr:UDP-Glycosyltransferase superfamily protein [Euphorbia peplus]